MHCGTKQKEREILKPFLAITKNKFVKNSKTNSTNHKDQEEIKLIGCIQFPVVYIFMMLDVMSAIMSFLVSDVKFYVIK